MNSKRPRNNRNNPRRGSGGNRPPHSLDSNGPDVKIRGNPNQIYEKYSALSRDAYTSGERILSENYAQHAEHYYRLANADGGRHQQQQQQNQSQQQAQPTPDAAQDAAPAPVAAAEAEKEAVAEPAPKDMSKEPQPAVD